MVSIFWSPRGIQLLKYLPEGQSFDGQYFIEEILQEIAQDQYAQDAKRNKKLFYLHFDNAPSHRKTGVSEFCKKNKLFILPQTLIHQIWRLRTFSYLATSRKSAKVSNSLHQMN